MSLAYLRTALCTLRDSAGEVNRIGPSHSPSDALRLVVNTAIQLLESSSAESPSAVVYMYDPERRRFDAASRVSAGEHNGPVDGDAPRPHGMGAHAVQLQRRILSYEDVHIPLHSIKQEAGVRAMACYPLLVSGVPVGVLYIGLGVDRRFTDDELLILDTFVHQVAVAIHNTRRFERINRALQRKVGELERLRRAEQVISSRPNLDDTLREILNTALALIGAEHGSCRLLDKRLRVLRLSAIAGDDGGDDERLVSLPVDEHGSVVGWVAQHRRPARIADLRQPPWAEIYRPLYRGREMRSELAVPLLGAGDRLEGVVNVESPDVDAFDEDDQHLLEALGTQAVIAIQEAKLLETIEDVSSRLLSQRLPDLLALIVERACDLINAPHGAVWTLSPDRGDTLVLQAGTPGHPIGETLPVGDSLIGLAMQSRKPLISPDVREDSRFLRRDLARQMSWVSALIVPLLMRDGALRGALTVYTSEPRIFSDWDQRLLTWLANHTALAVQDSDYLEQLSKAREQHAVAETFAALGDVAANLLHRVNNLIGVIPARVQGIAEKCPDAMLNDYLSSALDDIEDSARAAMDMARETMAYLRPLRLRSTRIDACYQTALRSLSVPPGVTLEAGDLTGLPPVLAGEEQLSLVLTNLIENAFDALADRGGHIHVTGRAGAEALDETQHWVEVTVADNGPGVPAAERDRIFDPAFSTKRSPNKMGFGLWWVKSFVQRFGGSITLAENGGPGCAFVIRLPPARQD
jgi:GAF domain-containing protein